MGLFFSSETKPVEDQQVSEVQRVQMNIAQCESGMQQKFLQIGQMFYAENKNNKAIDTKYAEIVDQITKLDENRKGFFNHKLRLEGNMQCMSCGQIIPFGSVYCAFCGKRADASDSVDNGAVNVTANV